MVHSICWDGDSKKKLYCCLCNIFVFTTNHFPQDQGRCGLNLIRLTDRGLLSGSQPKGQDGLNSVDIFTDKKVGTVACPDVTSVFYKNNEET